MKKKIVLSVLLAALLVLGLSLSAFAFSDITDNKTESAVAALQSLGVINGFPDGTFRPDEPLTRAQFTKMAVSLKQGIDSQLSQAANITIFPDVKSNHWAIAFVNYAAKNGIIKGRDDGLFHPSDNITFGEAVTILMRILGYDDASVGYSWPDGYINAAANCGLTAGLTLGAKDSISRGSAAQLFGNMLSCRLKDSKTSFLASICPGGLVENAVLLSVDAVAADGTQGAVKVLQNGEESIYKTDAVLSEGLLNKVVTLALDADGNIMTVLVTGEANYKSFVLSTATALVMRGTDGTEIPVTTGMIVILNDEPVPYSSVYLDLRAGVPVRIYYNAAGKIQKLYIDTAKGEEAAVLTTAFAQGSNPFIALFGLDAKQSYSIIRDGEPVDASALELYDTAIYDAKNRIFHVSSLKLSGVYEDVKGDYNNPTEIYILGNWFALAPSARDTVADFKPGDKAAVTVLLTADGRVAAIYPQSKVTGRPIGIANEEGLTLPNGLVLRGEITNGGAFCNRLAYAYTKTAGVLTFSAVEEQPVNADFDVKNGKVGEAVLANNAALYDSINGYSVMAITADDIPFETVSAAKIRHIAYDNTGKVCLMLLQNVTGDCYTYGKIEYYSAGYDGLGAANTVVVAGQSFPTYQPYTNGVYGGVAIGPSGYADGFVALNKLDGLTTADFLSSSELKAGDKVYKVAANTRVFLEPLQKYVTIYEARSYGGTVEAYYDDVTGKIRVIVVK